MPQSQNRVAGTTDDAPLPADRPCAPPSTAVSAVSRRRFLGAAGGAAALLSLPGCAGAPALPRPTAPVAGPPSPDGACRFLVVGDTQRSADSGALNDRARAAIYDRLRAALADPSLFVMHLGDVVETGDDAGQWRDDFGAPFWDLLTPAQKCRVYPMPGNHEYKTHFFDYGGDLRPYMEAFPHLHGHRYYQFTCGRAAFVVFDSGRNGIAGKLLGERWQNGSREQERWLRDQVLPDVAGSAREGAVDHLFVFVHKPARPTPILVRNRQTQRVLSAIERWNHDGGRGLRITSFHGHIHTFAHMRLGNVDQVICGGGGGRQAATTTAASSGPPTSTSTGRPGWPLPTVTRTPSTVCEATTPTSATWT